MEQRKQELQEQILAGIDMTREFTEEELFDRIDEVIKVRGKEEYISITEKQRLRREIFNSIRRLDVLQELVEDTSITEIMINGAKEIFVERDGKLMRWDKEFESDRKLEDVIQTIVAGANRIINESSPIVDARLKDGSRVNIVLPPIAIGGPTVTIRKFPKETMTMEKLVAIGSLTEEAAEFLKKLVIAGYNIFVSGGTGSGKTTFLNALSNYVPSEERIITIEDSAELQIRNIPNLVRLEVRNANVEGKNEISIRDLIKSSLRMRPDRIIVGEVRDASSIDMLQALNTGHNGMSTGHS
ncbi:ATPase, T2SS/T4P/T4SS family, partial [Lachnoclostridium sp.]